MNQKGSSICWFWSVISVLINICKVTVCCIKDQCAFCGEPVSACTVDVSSTLHAGGRLASPDGSGHLKLGTPSYFKGWLATDGKLAAFRTAEPHCEQGQGNDDSNLIEISLLDNNTAPISVHQERTQQPPVSSSAAQDEDEIFEKPSLDCQFGKRRPVRPSAEYSCQYVMLCMTSAAWDKSECSW